MTDGSSDDSNNEDNYHEKQDDEDMDFLIGVSEYHKPFCLQNNNT